jgi:D-methionine transport system ATP-binding protein
LTKKAAHAIIQNIHIYYGFGSEHLIKLSHIEKTYETPSGPVKALKGIDLEIGRGEIFGIIGLSGAGKSTLVRCINMLERPTAGKVIVDGKDMTALSESELRQERKQIGMIFQHFNLLSSATVYDNIAFPLRLVHTDEKAVQAKVSSLLNLVGLDERAQAYPSQLSGGQKQRVGIARALASDPKILLCDEATSALDPQTTKAILQLIRDINHKLQLTVVVITHEMQVIKEICDKVAVLDGGIIAEQGSVLDVFTNPQQPLTKDFISVLLSNDLPAAFRGSKISGESTPGSYLLLRLTFIGESADDPVIAGMIRNCPVEVTMLFGSLDQIKNTPYGRMIIGITGGTEEISQALAYLRSQELRLEVIGYVKRHTATAE